MSANNKHQATTLTEEQSAKAMLSCKTAFLWSSTFPLGVRIQNGNPVNSFDADDKPIVVKALSDDVYRSEVLGIATKTS